MNDPSDLIPIFQDDPVLFGEMVLGQTYWAKQEEIMMSVRDNKRTSVYAGHNVGKALALSTEIPTPRGMTTMGELELGDTVFDERGKPCTVTYVSPIHVDRPCYRLTFSDGTEIVADADHQWYAENVSERREFFRGVDRPGKVRTTQELFDARPLSRGYRWSIPVAGPLVTPAIPLPLDPYVLGVWLGDGTRGTGLITHADPFIWEEMASRFHPAEFRGHSGKAEIRLVPGLATRLREIGVLHDKHVPEAYFFASECQRRDLLAGILDTDGSVNRAGLVTFCSADEALSQAVFRLAASLGLKPNAVRRREARLYGVRKKDRYRVSFSSPDPVFYLPRKAERQRGGRRTRTRQRMIVSIEPVPSEPTRCIQVDSPRSLFLATRACIPTHNTFIVSSICWWFASCFEDAIVLTTAATAAQVKDVLWREMRTAYSKARIPLGGELAPKAPRYTTKAGAFAKGFTHDSPDSVHGFHSSNVLIVFDEAQAIQDIRAWEAFDSMMTSRGAKMLVIGNPLYAFGPFAQTLEDPRWNTIHISCLDHPNVTSGRELIPGAVMREQIDLIRDHPLKGEGTLHWRTRIEGKFPELGSDNLFPRQIVEASAAIPEDRQLLQGRYIGIDPAEHGTDRTVIAVMIDGRVTELEAHNGTTSTDTAKLALKAAARWDIFPSNINYDCIGPVGGELKRTFQAMGVPAHAVHVGREPVGDWATLFGHTVEPKVMFLNRRAELHWALRRLFELQRVSIPPEFLERFKYEACQILYGFFDDGRLYIESKDKKYRPRVGISPDHVDAVILCLARDRADYSEMKPSGADLDSTRERYDPSGRFF